MSFSHCKIYSDKRFVAGMLDAGAAGYLLKDCAFEELALAVHTVVANKIYLGTLGCLGGAGETQP